MVDEEEELEEATPRAIWSGTITFGLVSVPVDLFSANRPRPVSLRMLAPDGTPVRREYVCPEDEKPIPREEIVRGYEVEPGQHVVVEEEELEALEPKRSRDIDLRQFVREEELPPLLFERAYFLAPASDSTKPYRLLAETMEKSGKIGIASFVMRGKAYLVAIIAERGLLRAETLRYPDEVRAIDELGLELPKPAAKEVTRVRKRIKKLTAKTLESNELRDEWVEEILARAEQKRSRGRGVVELAEEADVEEVEPVDILEVLKERLGVAEEKPKKRPSRADGRSKEQLYERAKALDIPGRSKMTRDELLDAIRHAR